MPVQPQAGRQSGRQAPAISAWPIDFFISRRGSAGTAAQEVAEILKEDGYSVLLQDHDFRQGENFIAAIDEALRRCRDLIVLLTTDYADSKFTMMELTNFLAAAGRADGERRLIVLRIEDCEPGGVLAGHVYGDLAGVEDADKRRAIILSAVAGQPSALPPPPRTIHGVPPRNRDFVGRDDFLAQLHATLLAPEPAATAAALQGLGGIGKSSLAGEYAHRFGGDYAGVWWVPAENRTMLIGSLVELATAIDDRLGSTFLPRIAEPPDLEKLARAGLSKLAAGRRPWLLIYDNVESPDAIEGLVPGAGARLLITTRFADWPGWASEIALDVMSAEAATEFLLRRSGGTDRQGAAKLAAALGHLPLALDHAGAYLRRAGTSFARYCDRVRGAHRQGATGHLGQRAGDIRPRDRARGRRVPGGGHPAVVPVDAGARTDSARHHRRYDPAGSGTGGCVGGAHGGVAGAATSISRRDPGDCRAPAGAGGRTLPQRHGRCRQGDHRDGHSTAGRGISGQWLQRAQVLAAMRDAAAARVRAAAKGAPRQYRDP